MKVFLTLAGAALFIGGGLYILSLRQQVEDCVLVTKIAADGWTECEARKPRELRASVGVGEVRVRGAGGKQTKVTVPPLPEDTFVVPA